MAPAAALPPAGQPCGKLTGSTPADPHGPAGSPTQGVSEATEVLLTHALLTK